MSERMIRCYCCKKIKPESEFIPSWLKRYDYKCKACRHEYYLQQKAAGKIKKQSEIYSAWARKKKEIEEARDRLEEVCGGLRAVVLNMPNPDKGEYIYMVYNTGGEGLKTNDKAEFLEYLRREA